MTTALSTITTARREEPVSLESLTAQAREVYAECVAAVGDSLMRGVQLGHLLLLIKERVPRGGFKPWIAENIPLGYPWCSICMRAAKTYDALVENEKLPQGNLWEFFGSIRDLATWHDLALDGQGPDDKVLTKKPTPKAKPDEAEARAEYAEDVDVAASKIVDTREVELLARVQELEGQLAELQDVPRIKALKAREQAVADREARANALVVEYEAKLKELEAREAALAAKETKPKRAPRKTK